MDYGALFDPLAPSFWQQFNGYLRGLIGITAGTSDGLFLIVFTFVALYFVEKMINLWVAAVDGRNDRASAGDAVESGVGDDGERDDVEWGDLEIDPDHYGRVRREGRGKFGRRLQEIKKGSHARGVWSNDRKHSGGLRAAFGRWFFGDK
jgi:hypothetical protein